MTILDSTPTRVYLYDHGVPYASYASTASRFYYLTGPLVVGDFHHPLPYNWRYCQISGDPGGERTYVPDQYTDKRTAPLDYSWLYDYGDSVLPDNFSSELYNQALSRFYERIRGTTDLSVDIAQTRQNLAMFRKSDQLLKYARDLKSRNPKRWIKDVSSLWLEYVYGWKPIVQDLYDIADHSFNRSLSLTRRVVGSKVLKSKTVGDQRWQIGTFGSYDLKTAKEYFEACRFEAYLDLSQVGLSQWTSLNPVSIAWELLPYSFVVDWFYDVSSFLRNTESSLLYSGLPVGQVAVSQLRIIRGVALAQDRANPTVPGESLNVATRLFCRYGNFRRTTSPSMPRPMAPKFKVDLGSARLRNAAALLGNLLRR